MAAVPAMTLVAMGMRSLFAFIVTAGFMTGCGGSVILVDGGPEADGGGPPSTSSGDDGSNPSGSSNGGPGPAFAVCPPSLPSVGDPCGSAGQGCAYVINGVCTALVCDGTGHWHGVAAGSGC